MVLRPLRWGIIACLWLSGLYRARYGWPLHGQLEKYIRVYREYWLREEGLDKWGRVPRVFQVGHDLKTKYRLEQFRPTSLQKRPDFARRRRRCWARCDPFTQVHYLPRAKLEISGPTFGAHVWLKITGNPIISIRHPWEAATGFVRICENRQLNRCTRNLSRGVKLVIINSPAI